MTSFMNRPYILLKNVYAERKGPITKTYILSKAAPSGGPRVEVISEK